MGTSRSKTPTGNEALSIKISSPWMTTFNSRTHSLSYPEPRAENRHSGIHHVPSLRISQLIPDACHRKYQKKQKPIMIVSLALLPTAHEGCGFTPPPFSYVWVPVPPWLLAGLIPFIHPDFASAVRRRKSDAVCSVQPDGILLWDHTWD